MSKCAAVSFVGWIASNTECSGSIALAFGLNLDRGIEDVIRLLIYEVFSNIYWCCRVYSENWGANGGEKPRAGCFDATGMMAVSDCYKGDQHLPNSA